MLTLLPCLRRALRNLAQSVVGIAEFEARAAAFGTRHNPWSNNLAGAAALLAVHVQSIAAAARRRNGQFVTVPAGGNA